MEVMFWVMHTEIMQRRQCTRHHDRCQSNFPGEKKKPLLDFKDFFSGMLWPTLIKTFGFSGL